MSKISTILFFLIIHGSSAQMTTSTTCKVVGNKLTVSTKFNNKTNTDVYLLLSTWGISGYSSGLLFYSTVHPNCNVLHIIPQSWSRENKKLIFDAEISGIYTKSYPYYYLIPIDSSRFISYSISFINKKRMRQYLTNSKLMLYYTYQSSASLDSTRSLFGTHFIKKIYDNQLLDLGLKFQLDVHKKTPPNKDNISSECDFFKLFTYGKSIDTLNELQIIQFHDLPKRATKVEYVNLYPLK